MRNPIILAITRPVPLILFLRSLIANIRLGGELPIKNINHVKIGLRDFVCKLIGIGPRVV